MQRKPSFYKTDAPTRYSGNVRSQTEPPGLNRKQP
jgi:hypothetical protein